MLGFVALSQTPLSQAATAVTANAFLPTILAQFSTGDLLYEAAAFHTLGGVSATGEVDIEFDAQATTSMAEATTATTLNAVLTDAQAGVTPTAATASFSISAFSDVDAKASITFPNTSATLTAETLEFDAEGEAAVTGVELSLDNFALADEDAQASITLPAVTASFSAEEFADVDAKAITSLPSVSSSSGIGFIAATAHAYATLTGVSVALSNIAFADEDAKASITLGNASATFSFNLPDEPIVVTGVRFPYEDYADRYNTQRVVYISQPHSNNTVYIAA